MLKRLLISLLVALIPAQGWGQSLQQGGQWRAGHVPMYSQSGGSTPIVQDTGGAGGGGLGVGLSELGITARGTGTAPFAGQGTGQFGTVFQIQDAPTTNATGYHALSFSANAQGGGLIAYNAYGGASPLNLNMDINGTTYQFPFVLSGVVGPNSSTVGHLACWNNTSGTLLSDCLASTPYRMVTTDASGIPALSTTAPINGWGINLPNQIFYCEGTSFIYGALLGTGQLPNGGLTGNYCDDFANSVWATGKGNISWNDGVSGSQSGAILARYSTGNSCCGPTIPSAHSLAPTVTGTSDRRVFIVEANGYADFGSPLTIGSGTYDNGTGAVVLTLSAPTSTIPVGYLITVQGLTGTGAFGSLEGTFTAATGTTGSTVKFVTSPALGASTITGGNVTISYQQSIINFTALTTLAQSEGWYTVVLTMPVMDLSEYIVESVYNVNQAVRQRVIPSDLVMDMATWVQNNAAPYYIDTHHLTLLGHRQVAANMTACFISGGCQVNYSGAYVVEPTNFRHGLRADNIPDGTPFVINSFIQSVPLVSLTNAFSDQQTNITFTSLTSLGALSNQFNLSLTGPDYGGGFSSKFVLGNNITGGIPFMVDAATDLVTHLTNNIFGSTGRAATFTLASGNLTDLAIRFDDNSSTVPLKLQNYAITAAAQGLGISWTFGAGGSLGAIAGRVDVLATDTWAAAGNRSAKILFQVNQAGSIGNALQLTTAAATFPGAIDGVTTIAQSGAYNNTAGTIQFLGNAGGSADALTLTPSPALTALTTGAMFVFKASANNATTTPALTISSLAGRTLVKRAATALAADDLVSGGYYFAVIQASTIQIINPTVP
jgi:hypothetical protein